jgi:hypothetical protein
MKALSFLGSPALYVVLIPFLFWCVDEKQALRLGLLLLFSAWLNSSLKMLFKQPRPYQLDRGVARAYESGASAQYGLPSGHAQHSLALALGLASWKKKAAFFALPAAFLIALSRLYLGVHFPTDLLAGWFLALLVCALERLLSPFLEAFLEKGGTRAKLITLALLAFVMNSLHAWDPGPGGLLLGFGGGYVFMRRRFPLYTPCAASFCTAPPAAAETRRTKLCQRILFPALRYALGMAGLFLLYLVSFTLLPEEASSYYRLARFCFYGITGFWVSAAAPALFVRLRLVPGRNAPVAP